MIVSQEGPIDGQVKCVASGYPAPKISWYYCEPRHTRYDSNVIITPHVKKNSVEKASVLRSLIFFFFDDHWMNQNQRLHFSLKMQMIMQIPVEHVIFHRGGNNRQDTETAGSEIAECNRQEFTVRQKHQGIGKLIKGEHKTGEHNQVTSHWHDRGVFTH